MAQVRRRPAVLPEAAQIRRIPVRDHPLGILLVPAGVGPVEPETGRIGRLGVCAGHHRRRHPSALPRRGAVAGDIPHGGGARRHKARTDSRTRGGDQPLRHSEEPRGPGC